MTEKEKMIAGLPYLASDPELIRGREEARLIVKQYNDSLPSAVQARKGWIRRLFGETRETFQSEPPFHCDYGFNISIGERFYANFDCIILDCAKVVIGNNVALGPRVSLLTAEHPVDAATRIMGSESARPIFIGDNVWIGAGAIVLPGVIIGENTVIGAGSVVTRDIPANVVAVGNPCKVLRSLG